MRTPLVTLLALAATSASAGEGKWMPQQVLEQGPKWVRAQGFQLPLSKLWDAKKGGGLLANAVQVPGCSASFVSKDGLLITNHHCVVGILQQHSTPERDLTKTGFVARTREEEKPAKAYWVQVPVAFRDVTEDVVSALAPGIDDQTRFKAVEAAQKIFVSNCEKKKGARCTFASFDAGRFYTLTEFTELTDVRLVYAPPGAVGDYGGEVDNWMWPRHSGDFALLRVYQDGKPFSPPVVFPLSSKGVKEGDGVAVLGYPGRSYRALLAEEMAERERRDFPTRATVFAAWARILEEEAARSPQVAVAVADDLRSLLNVKKNAQGTLAGLKRGHLVEKQRAADAEVKAWAQKKKQQDALDAWAGLVALNDEAVAAWDRDLLLDLSVRSARALQWPLTLARRSVEGTKPDLEREPAFMERELVRLRSRLERDQSRYARGPDDRLLADWVTRALALPEGRRIAAVDAQFKGLSGEALKKKLDALVAGSKVVDVKQRLAMFDETPAQLHARKDPLLELGFALDAERKALQDVRERRWGAEQRLRPVWRKAVIAHAGRPVAPDANSTLRVSFGRVRGYSPRDAVWMRPQTTLAGAVAKHTGAEPFDLPPPVRDAFDQGRFGRWADEKLGGVPTDFLADCDTTSGNSGSPVIDGQGRLVGVNFDRVWENVANDFGFNDDVARNVVADVRYLLWLLEEVEGAKDLLAELGIPPSR